MLIVGEGVDFAGKTTALEFLAQELRALYYSTPPKAFSSLRTRIDKFASNEEHYQFYLRAVQAASAELEGLSNLHSTIIVDRYWPTTVAYHRAMGLAADLSDFGQIIQPDLIIYFMVRPDIQLLRLRKRGMTEGDRRDWPFQDLVREKYDEVLASLNVVRIDTSDLTREEVLQQVRQSVSLVRM